MLNKERIINLLQWFILLAMFAYDGFTYLPEESNFALLKSVYYVFIFTAFVLIACLQMREAKLPVHPTNLISYGIQIFVWLYFVRLFYDFMIAGVEQEIVTNPFAAVFLYVNAAIVPFYGFQFFRWDLINLRKLNTAALLIFLTMGTISLSYILNGKALEYIGSDGRFMGNASMDTIGFGHLGTTITLLAISLFYQKGINILHKLLSLWAIVTGLFISVAAGSRGALVALIICFIAYLYMNGHKMKVLIGLPILAVLLLALLPILNDFLLNTMDNHALERLYNSIYAPENMDNDVTSGRDILYDKAWHNFINSPLIGSTFFIEGEYVHNSVLESFMGMGIFGGLLFIIMVIYSLVVAFHMAEQEKQYLFCTLLFVQYLSYSLFSRTLSMLPLFWMSLYLVHTLNTYRTQKT
jgi:O-antigen ligase